MARKLLLFFCLCLPLLSFTKKQKKKGARSTTTATASPGVSLPYSAAPLRKGQPATEAQKAEWKIDYKVVGTPLPPLRVVTPAGKAITNESVANDANFILMFFNPTCEHCEEMTTALEKNIFLFKKSKIVMVAGSMMMPYLEAFRTGLQTDQYPTLQIGVDSSDLINKAYNYESLPQLNVYGPDRRLIKVLNGITAIDSLKPYIQ